MKIKTFLTSIVMVISLISVRAQQVTDGHTNSWLLLLNRVNFSEKWSITNELHERTGHFFHDQGQLLIRPSVDYHAGKNVEFSLGYSFVHSWSYEPYFSPLQKTENNLWEQLLLKSDAGSLHFQHRFRQENRWMNHIDTENGQPRITGNDYSNRFRYRFTLTFDLFRFKTSGRSIFFNGFDEIWFTQSANLLPKDFNRNWLYLGLGFRFNPDTHIQAAYLHQYDKTGTNSFVSSPVVQFTLTKNFNL